MDIGPKSDWWGWVTAVAGTSVYAAIAKRMSVEESITAEAIAKWSKGGRPRPESAISFARAYGESPAVALIEAGYMTPEEAYQQAMRFSADALSDAEIAAQVTRRFRNPRDENGSLPADSVADELEEPEPRRGEDNWRQPRGDAMPL